MKVIFRNLLLVMTFALASCGSEPPRAVAFFQENDDERSRVLADCRTGEHRGKECNNAEEAERLIVLARKSAEDQREIDSWITR